MNHSETNRARRTAGLSIAVNGLLSMYPVMLLLLMLSLFPKRPHWWVLAVLHLVLTVTFAVVTINTLNPKD